MALSATTNEILALRAQGLSRLEIRLRLNLTKGQVDNAIYRQETLLTLRARGAVEYHGPKSGARNRPSKPETFTGGILPVEVTFDPPPGKTNLWNIKTFQCRWLDDEGFFCAEPTKPTRSYCDHHHALCWVKTRRQKENAT